jgi:hypothetical protein
MPVEEALSAFSEAFHSWSDVCGLEFFHATPTTCDILITFGRIDGSMGVLAWSELPPGDDRMLTQKYDTGDGFVVAVTPSRGKIDLVAVAAHEIGHALGLDHTGRGTGDLLEPVYLAGKRTPQAGDIRRIQMLYGPPHTKTTTPAPAPDPVPGGQKPVRIVIKGADLVEFIVTNADEISIPGYSVKRLGS